MTLLVAASFGSLVGTAAGRLGRHLPEPAALRRILLALVCAVGIAAVLVPALLVIDAGGVEVRPLSGADDPRLPLFLLAMHGGQLGAVVCARTMGEDLGLRLARRGYGLAAVVALGAIGVSALWSLLLNRLGAEFGNQVIVDAISDGADPRLIVAVVLFAPILEELLFRGWVLPRLMRRFGEVPGFLLTALGFTALHLDAPQVAPPILALALALGWLRLRTRSVWPGVLAHALNNGLALALAGAI